MKRKILIIAIIACMCLIPTAVVFVISHKELNKYKVDNNYQLKEKAYGSLINPSRQEIKEYYEVKGEISSNIIQFIEIPMSNSSEIKMVVEEGEEVYNGQIIGYCNGVNIISSYDGVVKVIEKASDKTVVKIQSFEGLVLKAFIPGELEDRFANVMYDEAGIAFTLISKSKQYKEEGIECIYSMSDISQYRFGQKFDSFRLYTGQIFSETLVIPKDCIYQKNDKKNYVRLCDDGGYFIREQEVELGLEINNFIAISGLKEEDNCDSGYSYVMQDKDVPRDMGLDKTE